MTSTDRLTHPNTLGLAILLAALTCSFALGLDQSREPVVNQRTNIRWVPSQYKEVVLPGISVPMQKIESEAPDTLLGYLSQALSTRDLSIMRQVVQDRATESVNLKSDLGQIGEWLQRYVDSAFTSDPLVLTGVLSCSAWPDSLNPEHVSIGDVTFALVAVPDVLRGATPDWTYIASDKPKASINLRIIGRRIIGEDLSTGRILTMSPLGMKSRILNIDDVSFSRGSHDSVSGILGPTGTLTGVIIGEANRKPLGAVISFPGSGIAPVVSDPNTGVYSARMPTGIYAVACSLAGYVRQSYGQIEVKAGQSAFLNFAMIEMHTREK